MILYGVNNQVSKTKRHFGDTTTSSLRLSALIMARFRLSKVVVGGLLLAGDVLAGVYNRESKNAGLESFQAREKGWPYAPLRTEGRDIVNRRGEKVTWAGLNWPMSGMCLWCTSRLPEPSKD